jgi:carbamoyltransferase
LAFGAGAALLTNSEWSNFVYPSPYIGFEYSDSEIKTAIEMAGFPIIRNDVEKLVQSLKDDMVIGFFSGKSEFGPRALGARSIIASPINPKMKETVNAKIKFREAFRPFAPVILESNAKKYFDVKNNANYEFMNFVVNATQFAKDHAPAIVHEDGTSRVQVLKKGKNLRLEKLLEEWEKKSGCAVLLNTSFNLRGEPIVETPSDAIRTFFSSGLDLLVLGDYIIMKQSNAIKQ